MKRKKLTLMNIKSQELTRKEMRNVMAGSGQCPSGCKCELTCAATGCKPLFDTSGTCEGSDGCTYSNATSC